MKIPCTITLMAKREVLMDLGAYGNGRSKLEANYVANDIIMRKLRKLGSFSGLGAAADKSYDGNNESLINELTNMNHDMLKSLRDYCFRHYMLLPTIEIIKQSGTPNAPEFVACCSVASIIR
ncbi:hypothetical protein ACLKA7_011680 [Drosophila subpalustris]